MKIIEAMRWTENYQPLLDWMGRASEHHLPPNTSLRLNGLAVYRYAKEQIAEYGDWIVKFEDGSFGVRKEDELTLLKQNGEVAFFDGPADAAGGPGQ